MAKKAARTTKSRKPAKKAGARKKASARKLKKPGGAQKAKGRAMATGRAKAKARAKGKARGKGKGLRGGSGREETLAQTPATGRTVRGRTNPMPTKRSTGTAAGAGDSRRAPALERERKRLREIDETVPSPPSSLNPDRLHPSAARSGRSALQHAKKQHTEVSPQITGGDVDADWEDAYAVGDEAPGGDNPTPDQDRVDDIGKALGVQYADNEELKAADKIAERDKHRWELDPASAEDYPDHDED
jgi:hypothetical protein